ncbi:MAG: hypothetical protein ACP5GI_00105 [Sulfolobales archaeon]
MLSQDTNQQFAQCGSKLIENSYRRLRCPRYGFETDRNLIETLNTRRKAIVQIGGFLITLTAQQMTNISPNRCWELMSSLKACPLGRGERSDRV